MVPELEVRDIHQSLVFYTQVLDFHIRYERPLDGFAFIEYHSGNEIAQIMLDQIGIGRSWVKLNEPKPLGLGVSFEIATSELDTIIKRLESHRHALKIPLETKTYRIAESTVTQRQIWLHDPDGYLLRFSEEVLD